MHGIMEYIQDGGTGFSRPIDPSRDFGGAAFHDFSGNLGTGLNSTLSFDNYCGHSTVGFNLTDGGGVITFQGSFDGVNFSSVQMRELSSNGYTQSTDHPEDFLGSIAALKTLRFKRTTAATGETVVAGRMSKDASTLEGLENANPPHRFGNELFHKGFTGAGVLTDHLIYAPPSGERFAVTYFSFSIICSAGTNFTLHEGTGNASNLNSWLYSAYIDTPSADAELVSHILTTPFVSTGASNGLYLTTTASVSNLRGVFHGYNTVV